MYVKPWWTVSNNKISYLALLPLKNLRNIIFYRAAVPTSLSPTVTLPLDSSAPPLVQIVLTDEPFFPYFTCLRFTIG